MPLAESIYSSGSPTSKFRLDEAYRALRRTLFVLLTPDGGGGSQASGTAPVFLCGCQVLSVGRAWPHQTILFAPVAIARGK
jgi:hypothetical protein